jgi:N-acetylglucosaminyldiphosphoundecaprenol N-acetyl-beta-D-mannosaminyltransferase
MESKEIISLNINTLSYLNAINNVIDLAKNHKPSYICFANVHMIIEAYKNNAFKEIVNKATLRFPDGMPIVYAFKKIYKIKQDRIAGIDFMVDLTAECEKNNLSIFLFGSTEIVLSKLQDELLKSYPNLKIVGKISPPFKNFSDDDDLAFISAINKSKADVVFISLGCPKQETWMAKNYTKINAPLLGVGAAFEIHAKIITRAPLWMQKNGLEWLYRFTKEPKRLWKRYTQTNTLFIYLLLKKIIFR